jgi:hypothetical protein
MEYQIVTGKNRGDFISWVNSEIADGWKPVGGVAFDPVEGSYNQAMIKE